ncbi:Hypothetical protein NATL1_18191 [Prochlorococcus marinus str. NATL1A]|uniref:Uncharacterized protein n=1 Tax=Prochlorococcus marinus (strain NATL1A) TaxID=167555 RepID=A2C4G5_PROM1|nr:tetratricopeptide repeat protein [Prochlorococcus marinus]ABM76375.1 Hypothetical protein NATL1_18191 [Prochlorococcus marinus str. NATL1A]
MESSDKDQGKKNIPQVQTFTIPFALGEIKENITINTNTPSKSSKEKIINQALDSHSEGNIQEAKKLYQYLINQGFNDHRVFSNYGVILQNLGKLKEAKISFRKAIELNPNYHEAHANLGNILRDLGKLEEAEVSTLKAIELNPNFASAHCNLGLILEGLDKIEQSVFSFKRALETNPNDINIRINLSFALRDYIWSTQNNSSKKVSSIEELIELEKEKLKNKLKQYPFWFVDIPRTSSTSTQFMMWEKFGWPFGKRSKFVNDILIHERSLLFPNHTPSIITKYCLDEEIWESLESFTISRNPYTWCLSLWQLEINQDRKLKNKSFLQYLNLLDENLKVDLRQRKIRQNTLRQTDYLLDENENLLVKKILKFEDRNNVKSYLKSQGIPYKSEVHINKSKESNHQVSESEKKIIERIFCKDFEILGY